MLFSFFFKLILDGLVGLLHIFIFDLIKSHLKNSKKKRQIVKTQPASIKNKNKTPTNKLPDNQKQRKKTQLTKKKKIHQNSSKRKRKENIHSPDKL